MTALGAAPQTHFASPDDLTAAEPPEERGLPRDGVRMLVATPQGVAHAHFRDLPAYLSPGDLLVVNTSATLAAEFDGARAGLGPVVVHAAARLDDATWVVELRTAPDAARPVLDAAAGERIVPANVGCQPLKVRCSSRTRARGPPRRGEETGCGGPRRRVHAVFRSTCCGTGARSPTDTWRAATPWRPTRQSSPAVPGAPRCPAPQGRSLQSS